MARHWFNCGVMDRPASAAATLVLRLAHAGLAGTLELVDAPPPPGDGARTAAPRYACGACGLVLFAGAPLAHILPRGPRPHGVRCPGCGAINLTQVNGRLPPPPAAGPAP
jgi:hypothetical protein